MVVDPALPSAGAIRRSMLASGSVVRKVTARLSGVQYR
jgi:hypothetical protein